MLANLLRVAAGAHACMITHIARVRINRVRLPVLLVVSRTRKINLIGLSRRVRRWSRPASACSSPYSGWIWCLLTGFLPSSAATSVIYLFNRHTPSGQSRIYRVTQLRTDGVHCRESAGTGPVNLKVVRNGCCLGTSHLGPINMRLSKNDWTKCWVIHSQNICPLCVSTSRSPR